MNDDNYVIAVELLKDEFLNIDSLTDTLFKRLLDSKPKFDVTYLETKMYINEIRCILTDLKNYKCDLLIHDSSKKFLSHIVFAKLPLPFKRELLKTVLFQMTFLP